MYLTLTDMPLRELTLPETELSSVELRKLPLERLEVKGYVKIGKLAAFRLRPLEVHRWVGTGDEL